MPMYHYVLNIYIFNYLTDSTPPHMYKNPLKTCYKAQIRKHEDGEEVGQPRAPQLQQGQVVAAWRLQDHTVVAVP